MPHPFRNVVVTVLFHPPFTLLRQPVPVSLVLLGLLCASNALQAQPTARPTAADIDWLGIAELSEAQRAQIPDLCCGLYVEPAVPLVDGDPSVLRVAGTNITSSPEGFTEIEGKLIAQQNDVRASADRGTYDQKKRLLTLEGNIQLRQSGLLMVGESAAVHQDTGTSELANASYLLHESGIRGSAGVLVYRDADGIVTIDNGVFTRCEPGDNAWLVQGDHIELNRQTGMGTARAVTLRVKDVPVLYVPWISFPITDQRASGFLAPVIGSTRDGGLDIATPYYLNLAPNYDLTLTPRLQIERGVMLGAESRYLGRNFGQQLTLNLLSNDKLFDPATRTLPNSNSPPKEDRWAIDYDFSANLGLGWSAVADYRSVSDEDYFQDFGNDGLNSTTQSFLYRAASLNWRNRHWAFSAATQDIQLIDPSVGQMNQPYRTLPRLTLDGFYALPGGLEYAINGEYTLFDRDLNPARFSVADIRNGVLVTGSRFAVTPQLSLPLSNSFAFFTPTLKYKYAAYSLADQAAANRDNPTRGIPSFNLDTGLIFERDTTIAGTNYRQTLEPRLYYLYNRYEDQSDIPLFDTSELTFSFNQLFRDDRFSGKDRVGDANQLTVAVSSRFYAPDGQEKARVSVGQIRHFEDRRVTLQALPTIREMLSRSALTGEFSYQLAKNWRSGAYVEWNTRDQSADVGNVQVQYQSDESRILNVAWRYRDMPAPLFINGFDPRIKQSDVSAAWPLATNWNLVGRWNYDYSNDRTLEGIAGVEYSNCCWRVRVIARSWIDNTALFFGREDNNNGVFVQFELKGLGSILGGNVSSILNNGITGFQDRNNGRF